MEENNVGSGPQTTQAPVNTVGQQTESINSSGAQNQPSQYEMPPQGKPKIKKIPTIFAIFILIIIGVVFLSRQKTGEEPAEENSQPQPTDEITQGVTGTPFASPVTTVTPKPSVASGGLPFGPFHFGEREGDYTLNKDGVVAGDVFTGGFIHFGTADTDDKRRSAESILNLAYSKGKKVIVSITDSYPCRYWNNTTFDGDLLLKDAKYLIPTVAKYYPDTVIGVMLLNEPHDPQDECGTQIPPQKLYEAARDIREEFYKEDAKTIPLGFGSPPSYMEGKIIVDGTITLSNAQYTTNRGTLENFIAQQEGTAKRLGQKLYLTANANQTGDALDGFLKTMCQKANTQTTIMVGYWTWNDSGGNQKVPLSDLTGARDACRGR